MMNWLIRVVFRRSHILTTRRKTFEQYRFIPVSCTEEKKKHARVLLIRLSENIINCLNVIVFKSILRTSGSYFKTKWFCHGFDTNLPVLQLKTLESFFVYTYNTYSSFRMKKLYEITTLFGVVQLVDTIRMVFVSQKRKESRCTKY